MKNYWQFILGALLGLTAYALIAPNLAGAAGSVVGVIDLNKAVKAHPSYDAKNAAFEAFKKQQDARLDSYRNKTSPLTDADKEAIVNLKLEINNAVADKYDELFEPLMTDVENAVRKVGMEAGIEVIIDAQAVLYGGLDLTPAIINALQ